ncbi:MAG: hypothetical protein WBM40_12635, partial [Thiohalocapsa sp.]
RKQRPPGSRFRSPSYRLNLEKASVSCANLAPTTGRVFSFAAASTWNARRCFRKLTGLAAKVPGGERLRRRIAAMNGLPALNCQDVVAGFGVPKGSEVRFFLTYGLENCA